MNDGASSNTTTVTATGKLANQDGKKVNYITNRIYVTNLFSNTVTVIGELSTGTFTPAQH